MDAGSLRDWIQWGTGHKHESTDIGQYHVGGKLAAIYLAESLEIVCRRVGSSQVYRFVDQHWGSRTQEFVGDIETVDRTALAWIDEKAAALPDKVGFTRVTLKGLKAHRRYEQSILYQRLANTYRNLIDSDACSITLDGQTVDPLELPESKTHSDKVVEIPKTKLSPGHFVRGRMWVLDRERIPSGRGVMIKAGIRTLFNGRLITDGETFKHNLSGRGSLQRLVGEIHLDGPQPTANKNNWRRNDLKWDELTEFMHEKMQPLVAYLNQVGESRSVTREQRKRTEAVRRTLETAFKRLEKEASSLFGVSADSVGRGGRKPPEPSHLNGTDSPVVSRTNRQRKGETQNRTPPPDGSIGRLLRQIGGSIPKIDYQALGQVDRSQWSDDRTTLVINTSYPLYDESSDPYIAETICLHLLKDDESFKNAPVSETLQQLDRLIWAWSEVRGEGQD